jgi:2-polyprenyl-6-methoxyphenol hydroxylase-like FAD-dependent oxidoreductase
VRSPRRVAICACDTDVRANVGVVQDDDALTRPSSTPEGATRIVRARYLAAADGGRSTVRRDLGIDLRGSSHTELVYARPLTGMAALMIMNRCRVGSRLPSCRLRRCHCRSSLSCLAIRAG